MLPSSAGDCVMDGPDGRNCQFRTVAGAMSAARRDTRAVVMVVEGEVTRHTQIKTQQVAAHPVVDLGAVENKLPLGSRRDFGRASQRLEGPLPELGVEHDQGRVVCEE